MINQIPREPKMFIVVTGAIVLTASVLKVAQGLVHVRVH